MFCTACGNRVGDDDAFCSNCGAPLSAAFEQVADKTENGEQSIEDILQILAQGEEHKGFVVSSSGLADEVKSLQDICLDPDETIVALVGSQPKSKGAALITTKAIHVKDGAKREAPWRKIILAKACGFSVSEQSSIFERDSGWIRISGNGELLAKIFIRKTFWGGGCEKVVDALNNLFYEITKKYDAAAYYRADNATTLDSFIELKGCSRITSPNATIALIGLCSLAFLIELCRFGIDPTATQLLSMGGDCGLLSINDGQVWRLITGCFLHCGIIHFSLNMFCLWSLGRMLEKMSGTSDFLKIYFISAIGGSVLSALLTPDVVSVGASGAIFGLVGGMIAYVPAFARRFSVPKHLVGTFIKSNVAFVLINFCYAARANRHMDNPIDVFAHIGGLVAGLIAGWWLGRKDDSLPGPVPV